MGTDFAGRTYSPTSGNSAYRPGFTITSDPKHRPQIVGSSYNDDPKKVPLIAYVNPQIMAICAWADLRSVLRHILAGTTRSDVTCALWTCERGG